MAHGSLRKKPAKRQNLQFSSISMASSSLSFSIRRKTQNSYQCFFFVSATLIVSIVALLGITSNKWCSVKSLGLYTYKVVNVFPHDPEAFTQGLLYAENDTLFESTGLYGESSVRKVSLQNGKVDILQRMDSDEFGEGLTLLGEKLYQVTWLKKTGFIYDRYNLSKFERFTHQMKDGWGLATDGKVLYGSDGSSTLYQINPQTFEVMSEKIVYYKGHQVNNLNELEFVNGEVWANVWQTDCIARMDPMDGSVLGWIFLQNLRFLVLFREELVAAGYKAIDVLNGIAWDAERKRIFVTGKLWPKLYEIKVLTMEEQVNDDVIQQLCVRDPFSFE